jgi:hypothetical protein
MKFMICGVVVPLAALFLWTSYADSLKTLNPIARNFLTSTALQNWNFGTLSDKLSMRTWELFFDRIVRDLIGNSWLLVVAVLGGLFSRREWFRFAVVLLTLFLIPLAVFTNLHFRHNYYAYANGVFLIAAVGLVCSDLWMADNRLKRLMGAAVFCGVMVFSSYHYLTFYYPRQGMAGDFSILKNDVDRNIAGKDDVIIVAGAGWSSEIPYYLDRRAVMLLDFDEKVDQELLRNLAPYRVGAIFYYGDSRYDEKFKRKTLSAFGIQSRDMRNYGQMFAYFNR